MGKRKREAALKNRRPRRPRSTLPKKPLVYDCVTYSLGNRTFILFSASAKELYSVVKINQREENKDTGYQRALSLKRVEKIAKFIDEGGTIPTAVLLSLGEKCKLSSDQRRLTVPAIPNAGWVIDGQHRLAGAHEAGKETTLPVVAVLGLPFKEQIDFFVRINQEQKGVPTSLYYQLLKHLPDQKTESDILAMSATELGNSLSRDEESPFFGRLVSTVAPMRGRQISITNFIRKVAPYIKLPSGHLAQYSPDERAKILNNYYRALQAVYPAVYSEDDCVFFKTVGFGALIDALPRFMHHAIRKYGNLRARDFVELFRAIEGFDFKEWRGRGTGSSYERESADELRKALDQAVEAVPSAHVRLD